jgi:hypothetical protein
LYGVVAEQKHFILDEVLTQPIYSNYRYVLAESLLDFDRFASDLWSSFLFSLFTAAYLVLYLPAELNLQQDVHANNQKLPLGRKVSQILWFFTFIILLIGILGSWLGWGLNRPYLGPDRTVFLIFGNSFPEHATELLLPSLLWMSGFATMVYLPIWGLKKKFVLNKRGALKFFIAGFLLFNLMIISFPLDPSYLLNANTLMELVYSMVQAILVVGCVVQIELRLISKMPHNILNNSKSQDEKGEKTSPNYKLIKPVRTFLGYMLVFIVILALIAYFIFVFPMYSEFSTFRVMQIFWTTIFRFFLTLSFWVYGLLHNNTNSINEVDAEVQNL